MNRLDALHTKQFPSERTAYTLRPRIYEISNINRILDCLLPDIVKLGNTIDDNKLRSNLNINRTLSFTKNSFFFYTRLGFILPPLGPLGDTERFIHKIPGTYKSDRPINITANGKVHLKCGCIDGVVCNGIREPILYSFGLTSPPGHKIFKEPIDKLFKKIIKSVLSHITF